jgi:O-antigen/teichoic acid export membrane protein
MWPSPRVFINYQYRRIRSWFQEEAFRRLFLNSGKLLSASGIAMMLGFATTALTARELGPDNYGVFALATTYQVTMGRLVSFNAWQAVIKYGSGSLHHQDASGLRQLMKLSFGLDISTAIVGTGLAWLLGNIVLSLLGWDPKIQPLLLIASVIVLFSWNGAPIAILRMYDRFDLLGYSAVLSAVMNLMGVGWCVLAQQDLMGFVLAYVLSHIAGQLFQTIASLWVARENGIGNFIREPMKGLRHKFPGIWDYVWTTNFHSTVRLLSKQADELIVAGLTDPSAYALFKVSKQFARILPMIVDPLTQSIYPELARLWAASNRQGFVAVIKRTTLLVSVFSTCAWLGFLGLGSWLIVWIFGPAYQSAYLITVIYLLALVIAVSTFSMHPAMLAMGQPKAAFKVLLSSTLVYLVILYFSLNAMGIIGAAVSYLIYYIIWVTLMLTYYRHSIRTSWKDANSVGKI